MELPEIMEEVWALGRLLELEKEARDSEGDMDIMEETHKEADDILCKILEQEGYEDAVRKWKRIPKGYL